MQSYRKYHNQNIDIDENSAVNLTEDPLYVMNHICLDAFKILFVVGFWQFDSDMSRYGSLYLRVYWASWVCRFMIFTQFGTLWAKFFFCSFLSSPSGTSIMHMLVHFMVFHRYLKLWLCSFFFILFFLSIPQTGESQLTCLQVLWFFFLPAGIYSHAPLVKNFVSVIVLKFFFFFWPRCAACGIPVPRPGIEPRPQQWGRQFLTIGLPGIPLKFSFYIGIYIGSFL